MNSTEQHRQACEIRAWKRLIRIHGRAWWEATKGRLIQKRGQGGLDYLLRGWNK